MKSKLTTSTAYRSIAILELISWLCMFSWVTWEIVQVTLISARLHATGARGLDFPYPLFWEFGLARLLALFLVWETINRSRRISLKASSLLASVYFVSYTVLVTVLLIQDPQRYHVYDFFGRACLVLAAIISLIYWCGQRPAAFSKIHQAIALAFLTAEVSITYFDPPGYVSLNGFHFLRTLFNAKKPWVIDWTQYHLFVALFITAIIVLAPRRKGLLPQAN